MSPPPSSRHNHGVLKGRRRHLMLIQQPLKPAVGVDSGEPAYAFHVSEVI